LPAYVIQLIHSIVFIILLFIRRRMHKNTTKKTLIIEEQKKQLRAAKNEITLKETLITDLDQQIIDIGDMQQKLRSFEHGQFELLIGLYGVVESGNIQAIKKILKQYNDKVQDVLKCRNSAPDINNLIGPELMSVRHLILSKARLATKSNIAFTVEIDDKVDNLGMPILDFIEIIGIWLNNAIEESLHVADAKIHLSLIIDQDFDGLNILEVRVSNNCRFSTPGNPDFLNKQGVSTKGDNRGNGLKIVQDQLLKHDNIHISTRITEEKFIQLLEIALDFDTSATQVNAVD